LRCPSCGEQETRVIDSRELDEAATIRRRRECSSCGGRFTTYERTESPRLTVLKRDGSRQEFDRDRLLSGLNKSLVGRPVSHGAAQAAAEEIEATLRGQGISEVTSGRIGELVLEHLRALDQLAYIRFASHYLEDMTELEVEALRAETPAESPDLGTIPRPRPVRPEA
jgi:transcriptional repressor NrdR